MNWVDLISAFLGLSCVVLAGRRLVANFWIGYVYNIFLLLLFWDKSLYASMAIQAVAFGINAYGHWRWTHPAAEEADADGSLAVTSLSFKEMMLLLAVTLFAVGMIYSLLVRTDDPQPVMDAVCTSLILLAQLLSARKKTECWMVWTVVNITNLILYIRAGLLFMPIVSALYLANGIWSLASWKKNERNS